MENEKARLRVHLFGTHVDLILPKEKIQELLKIYEEGHQKYTKNGLELVGCWPMCPTFMANLGRITGLEILPEKLEMPEYYKVAEKHMKLMNKELTKLNEFSSDEEEND